MERLSERTNILFFTRTSCSTLTSYVSARYRRFLPRISATCLLFSSVVSITRLAVLLLPLSFALFGQCTYTPTQTAASPCPPTLSWRHVYSPTQSSSPPPLTSSPPSPSSSLASFPHSLSSVDSSSPYSVSRSEQVSFEPASSAGVLPPSVGPPLLSTRPGTTLATNNSEYLPAFSFVRQRLPHAAPEEGTKQHGPSGLSTELRLRSRNRRRVTFGAFLSAASPYRTEPPGGSTLVSSELPVTENSAVLRSHQFSRSGYTTGLGATRSHASIAQRASGGAAQHWHGAVVPGTAVEESTGSAATSSGISQVRLPPSGQGTRHGGGLSRQAAKPVTAGYSVATTKKRKERQALQQWVHAAAVCRSSSGSCLGELIRSCCGCCFALPGAFCGKQEKQQQRGVFSLVAGAAPPPPDVRSQAPAASRCSRGSRNSRSRTTAAAAAFLSTAPVPLFPTPCCGTAQVSGRRKASNASAVVAVPAAAAAADARAHLRQSATMPISDAAASPSSPLFFSAAPRAATPQRQQLRFPFHTSRPLLPLPTCCSSKKTAAGWSSSLCSSLHPETSVDDFSSRSFLPEKTRCAAASPPVTLSSPLPVTAGAAPPAACDSSSRSSSSGVAASSQLLLPSHPYAVEGRLPNGLKYFILPHGYPAHALEVHMELHAGSTCEGPRERGMAHLCEHVSYMGSKKREKLINAQAETNAYTDFHHTVFFAAWRGGEEDNRTAEEHEEELLRLSNSLPSPPPVEENGEAATAAREEGETGRRGRETGDGAGRPVETHEDEEKRRRRKRLAKDQQGRLLTTSRLRLALEAMREVLEGSSQFTKERLNKERAAVISEASLVNTIAYRKEQLLLSLLHAETVLPLRFPIGVLQQLCQWNVKQLRSFHRRFYRPENAALYVVGDVAPRSAERLVQQVLGRLASSASQRQHRQHRQSEKGGKEEEKGGEETADKEEEEENEKEKEDAAWRTLQRRWAGTIKRVSQWFPPLEHRWRRQPDNPPPQQLHAPSLLQQLLDTSASSSPAAASPAASPAAASSAATSPAAAPPAATSPAAAPPAAASPTAASPAAASPAASPAAAPPASSAPASSPAASPAAAVAVDSCKESRCVAAPSAAAAPAAGSPAARPSPSPSPREAAAPAAKEEGEKAGAGEAGFPRSEESGQRLYVWRHPLLQQFSLLFLLKKKIPELSSLADYKSLILRRLVLQAVGLRMSAAARQQQNGAALQQVDLCELNSVKEGCCVMSLEIQAQQQSGMWKSAVQTALHEMKRMAAHGVTLAELRSLLHAYKMNLDRLQLPQLSAADLVRVLMETAACRHTLLHLEEEKIIAMHLLGLGSQQQHLEQQQLLQQREQQQQQCDEAGEGRKQEPMAATAAEEELLKEINREAYDLCSWIDVKPWDSSSGPDVVLAFVHGPAAAAPGALPRGVPLVQQRSGEKSERQLLLQREKNEDTPLCEQQQQRQQQQHEEEEKQQQHQQQQQHQHQQQDCDEEEKFEQQQQHKNELFLLVRQAEQRSQREKESDQEIDSKPSSSTSSSSISSSSTLNSSTSSSSASSSSASNSSTSSCSTSRSSNSRKGCSERRSEASSRLVPISAEEILTAIQEAMAEPVLPPVQDVQPPDTLLSPATRKLLFQQAAEAAAAEVGKTEEPEGLQQGREELHGRQQKQEAEEEAEKIAEKAQMAKMLLLVRQQREEERAAAERFKSENQLLQVTLANGLKINIKRCEEDKGTAFLRLVIPGGRLTAGVPQLPRAFRRRPYPTEDEETAAAAGSGDAEAATAKTAAAAAEKEAAAAGKRRSLAAAETAAGAGKTTAAAASEEVAKAKQGKEEKKGDDEMGAAAADLAARAEFGSALVVGARTMMEGGALASFSREIVERFCQRNLIGVTIDSLDEFFSIDLSVPTPATHPQLLQNFPAAGDHPAQDPPAPAPAAAGAAAEAAAASSPAAAPAAASATASAAASAAAAASASLCPPSSSSSSLSSSRPASAAGAALPPPPPHAGPLENAFQLLRLILTSFAFEEDAFLRAKQQVLHDYKHYTQDLTAYSMGELITAMAKEDPRFRNLQPEVVERLSLQQVRSAVLQQLHEAFVKGTVELNIVGDVDVHVLEQLSRVYLGDIKKIDGGQESDKASSAKEFTENVEETSAARGAEEPPASSDGEEDIAQRLRKDRGSVGEERTEGKVAKRQFQKEAPADLVAGDHHVRRKEENVLQAIPELLQEEKKSSEGREALTHQDQQLSVVLAKQVESPFFFTSLEAVSCASPFVLESQVSHPPYATGRKSWPAAIASAAAAAASAAPAAAIAPEHGAARRNGKKQRPDRTARREKQSPTAEAAAPLHSDATLHAGGKQKRIHVHVIDSDERAVVHIAGPAPNRWGIGADGLTAWEQLLPDSCCGFLQQQHERQLQEEEDELQLQQIGEEDVFSDGPPSAALAAEQEQRQRGVVDRRDITRTDRADTHTLWTPEAQLPEEGLENPHSYDAMQNFTEDEHLLWQETRRRHPAFGRAALWILQELVSKRMFTVLREEQRLTYDASFDFMSFEILRGGVFVVTIHTEPRLVDAVATAARRALTELVSTRPLQEYQLESAKKQILSRHNHDKKFARYWMELLVGLQLDELPMKNIAYIRDMQRVVESVTLDDIQQLLHALEIRPDTLWEAVGISGPTPPPGLFSSGNKPKISVAAALREY